jgi:hypothetical protein
MLRILCRYDRIWRRGKLLVDVTNVRSVGNCGLIFLMRDFRLVTHRSSRPSRRSFGRFFDPVPPPHFGATEKPKIEIEWRKPAKFCLEVEQIHGIAFEAVADDALGHRRKQEERSRKSKFGNHLSLGHVISTCHTYQICVELVFEATTWRREAASARSRRSSDR